MAYAFRHLLKQGVGRKASLQSMHTEDLLYKPKHKHNRNTAPEQQKQIGDQYRESQWSK
jgi:hypothetical protein